MDMVALPFCHFEKTTKKPLSKAYPKELVTIGDYIRKRRLDLKLTQKELGAFLGVDECTVLNWEKQRCQPAISRMPKLMDFLDHTPNETGTVNSHTQLRVMRIFMGMVQRTFARLVGIDPSTLSRLERGKGRPSEKTLRKVEVFLQKHGPIK